MTRALLFSAVSALALAWPAHAAGVCDVQVPAPPAATASASGGTLTAQGFERWKEEFRERALSAGIKAQIFDSAMGPVAFTETIVAKAANANERTQRIWDYLNKRINTDNVSRGRQALSEYGTMLSRIQKRTGVPPEVILAFWGIETGFGSNKGNEDIFQAMGSMAYEGGRREFYEANLIAAMRLMQVDGFDRSEMVGSWAGAVGHAQFMPVTWEKVAVDGDGDGRIDLWNSVADAFASKANYMIKFNPEKPWKPGAPWIVEVQPPAGFDFADSDMMIKKTVAEWEAMGVTTMDGRALTGLKGVSANEAASVFAPGGKTGPTVMTLTNFDRFWEYNPSLSYALAVALWAEAIAGRPGLQVPWPENEPDITRAQAYALQSRLRDLGFLDAEPDGDIGRGTRAGIRAYQLANGMVADGFPSCALLQSLMASQ